MEKGICELWIKITLRHLKIKFQEPMIFFYENEAAINMAMIHI